MWQFLSGVQETVLRNNSTCTKFQKFSPYVHSSLSQFLTSYREFNFYAKISIFSVLKSLKTLKYPSYFNLLIQFN